MSKIVHGIEEFVKDFTNRPKSQQWGFIKRLIYIAAVLALLDGIFGMIFGY